MTSVDRVVVGFDGSDDARCALDWAGEAAARHGAQLVVVVASGDPSYGGYSPLIVPGDVKAEEWAAEARDLLAEAGRPGRVMVARDRLPQRALTDASSATTLVAVGALGHGRLAGAVLGSVSLPVTRHARGPVVVVRPAADPLSSRIVVGVDGTAPSARALDFALGDAVGTEHRVVALRACPAGAHRAGAAEDPVHEMVAEAGRRFPTVPLELTTVAGQAARALSTASRHAALVVLGAGRHRHLDAVAPGSVGREVLHRASCPVAVVP